MITLADANGRPSAATNYAAHALVGAVAAAAIGPTHGPQAAAAAFVLVALAHAYFDAPVARGIVATFR